MASGPSNHLTTTTASTDSSTNAIHDAPKEEEEHPQSWRELPFTEKCDALLLVILYLLQGSIKDGRTTHSATPHTPTPNILYIVVV